MPSSLYNSYFWIGMEHVNLDLVATDGFFWIGIILDFFLGLS